MKVSIVDSTIDRFHSRGASLGGLGLCGFEFRHLCAEHDEPMNVGECEHNQQQQTQKKQSAFKDSKRF
jgi:hypothetical protein